MDYLKAFLVGGLMCVVGQILIDRTKITPARILVLFVVLGCLLGGLGVYGKLVDFAGAGATVPLPGFGYAMSKSVMAEVDKNGLIGVETGAFKAMAGGVTAAVLFSFLASLVFSAKAK
ncbi:MAG: stage V sporulation protein AE [Firmicutes bacterium]|nr:stage V sporulation protein AE [Bacillota bacterium]